MWGSTIARASYCTMYDTTIGSILNRASLVGDGRAVYADPNHPYTRKCAFDVGDYGLGYCANSLELGCDCVWATFTTLMCAWPTRPGEPVMKKKAICMHEEDGGFAMETRRIS